jgi:hypothetical protein
MKVINSDKKPEGAFEIPVVLLIVILLFIIVVLLFIIALPNIIAGLGWMFEVLSPTLAPVLAIFTHVFHDERVLHAMGVAFGIAMMLVAGALVVVFVRAGISVRKQRAEEQKERTCPHCGKFEGTVVFRGLESKGEPYTYFAHESCVYGRK